LDASDRVLIAFDQIGSDQLLVELTKCPGLCACVNLQQLSARAKPVEFGETVVKGDKGVEFD
jgi:hypothetical protein